MNDAAPPRHLQPLLQLAAAAGAAVLASTVAFVPGVVALAALAAVWPPAVAWGRPRATTVLRAYLPFVVGWLVVLFVYLRAMAACGAPVAVQPALRQLADGGFATPGLAAQVLSIVVLAPLLEELLFRGYLFTALAACRVPGPVVQLVCAAAFGLVHGAGYAFPIGVLALFFGWLRSRWASLLPCVVAHSLHNGVTVLAVLAWPGHLELLYPR